jgi:WD40 repeat protein
LLKTLTGHEHTIWAVTCTADRIATASFDGSLRLWDARGNSLAVHDFAPEQLHAVEFSPDGRLLLSCSSIGRIRLHDPDGSWVGGWHAQKTVNCVRFLPGGTRVATAGWNQLVQIWNLEGKELLALSGHLNGVTDVACSPDGRLASTSWDGTARIWSESTRGSRTVSGFAQGAYRLAASADGSRVLATSSVGEVALIDADGAVLFRQQPHASRPVAAAFAADTRRFVVAYADGAVFHGRPDDAALARIDTGLLLCGAAFLPDGNSIALSTSTGIFELTPGDQTAAAVSWPGSAVTYPRRLLSTADGRRLIVITEDDAVELWDPLLRQLVERVPTDKGTFVQSAALSRDGHSLLIADESGVAASWDLASHTWVQRFHGHQGGVLDAVFSPDQEQRYIVTASNDGTIRCFDRASGAQMAILRGHRAGVAQVAFLADGRRVISGSFDGTVRWWWLHPEDLLEAAEALGIAEPTAAERQLVPSVFR